MEKETIGKDVFRNELLKLNSELWEYAGNVTACAAADYCRVGKMLLEFDIANENTLITFLRALEMDTEYAEAWEGLGKVFETNGRNHEAKQCFEHAKHVRAKV